MCCVNAAGCHAHTVLLLFDGDVAAVVVPCSVVLALSRLRNNSCACLDLFLPCCCLLDALLFLMTWLYLCTNSCIILDLVLVALLVGLAVDSGSAGLALLSRSCCCIILACSCFSFLVQQWLHGSSCCLRSNGCVRLLVARCSRHYNLVAVVAHVLVRACCLVLLPWRARL